MDSALKRLLKKMPPPRRLRDSDVDWHRLEATVGLGYPSSFKEFIGAYGACRWFDHASPYYSTAKTDAEAKKFVRRVMEVLKPLMNRMRDENGDEVRMALYPEEGGLLPFMVDYGGSVYCWKTDRTKLADWPIVCWLMGPVIMLEKTTIAQMMLEWLERKPRMVDLWGDPNDLPPDRLQLQC